MIIVFQRTRFRCQTTSLRMLQRPSSLFFVNSGQWRYPLPIIPWGGNGGFLGAKILLQTVNTKSEWSAPTKFCGPPGSILASLRHIRLEHTQNWQLRRFSTNIMDPPTYFLDFRYLGFSKGNPYDPFLEAGLPTSKKSPELVKSPIDL